MFQLPGNSEYSSQPAPAAGDISFLRSKNLNIGLDIGSTTVKAVILDEQGAVIFSQYERHYSDTRAATARILHEMEPFLNDASCRLSVTGSGGMDTARQMDVPFIQEVLACNLAVSRQCPQAGIIIELGGEDAKVTYLDGALEQRMNETCAGGTGAFIDQMAAFLGVDAAGIDALAQKSKIIYPIASRCGVFAKSDIMPLLNEGCAREDIAASIMQAVVSQTISGLAQGRPIRGRVVFLGGPIHFLASLRERFVASLPEMTEAIFPEHGHFFVALGAALHSATANFPKFQAKEALAALQNGQGRATSNRLAELFACQEEYAEFKARHNRKKIKSANLEDAEGDAWLGLDCGSTTFKAALVDSEGRLLYSSYRSSKGSPLESALKTLAEIYCRKNKKLTIRGACSTGYGGAMLAAALRLDIDEVETVAHLAAATFFAPDVSFILDIGGQDIKCIRVKNGFMDHMALNEACSAGCGSFIENFAESLGLSMPEFVAKAIAAPAPVDLGTRCTVFMNSRVRQAQKENADIGDIAAGLAYSVVRNAMYKVMKISSPSALGRHVVAQGGSFLNDALLRALEKELGIEVSRPPRPELMGAFGAALIARNRLGARKSPALLTEAEIATFSPRHKTTRCKGCENHCLLTISSFGNGRKFVAGNRCEKVAFSHKDAQPNLVDWKYRRLFYYYEPLAPENAPRGHIGIPRALNIYENYPLWFTIFTRLGFRVELSAPSSKKLFLSACDTIPSQTVCYPAKLAHGHILNLVRRGIKNIFFPCIPREQADADFRHGTFNCPVVISYPELLACNMDALKSESVNFLHPFLPLSRDKLPERLAAIPLFSNIPPKELADAVAAGFDELQNYRDELRMAARDVLATLEQTGGMGLVLAGHPYHADPEIHHGIAGLAASSGMAVLTEDSVAHFMPDPGPLRVVDQWAYHSRLYRGAAFAGAAKNLAVLQLVSFGCGLDAITGDQMEEIATRNGHIYAQIKIDEGENIGGAKIRVRTLLAAMRDRQARSPLGAPAVSTAAMRESFAVFSPEMKKTHTLLVPQMSPMHFQFGPEIFASEGYHAEILARASRKAVETGLKSVNNDACFPAILVVGQLMEAIKSGKYDLDRVALVISQTGGGCRATNYIGFLRKALADAGLERVPIANFSTTLRAPGIRLTRRMIRGMIMAGHYGDALNRMIHRMRPYEREAGATDALARKWIAIAAKNIADGGVARFQANILRMIAEFDRLPLASEKRRPRYGLVGEILLKYHPDANNNAARLIEEEGGEVVLTDIMDFILYTFYEHIFAHERLAGGQKDALLSRFGIAFLELTRLALRHGFGQSRHFSRPSRFYELKNHAAKLLALGHQTGEGWLLGAEMERLLSDGVSGILCVQPFGCLPNHTVGKGLIRELRRRHPGANVMPLDYDPGTSAVNQINRIKLLMRSCSIMGGKGGEPVCER